MQGIGTHYYDKETRDKRNMEIIKCHSQGISHTVIAGRFHLSTESIRMILKANHDGREKPYSALNP